MLNIQRFICNMFRENCYVVSDETKECVIIDCGALYPEERKAVISYICDNQLKPVRLLGTHGHVDHHFGDNAIFEAYNLKPEVHHADQWLMESQPAQAQAIAGMNFAEPIPPIGNYFTDNDTITFGTHQLQVIATPGHTPGGVFLYCEAEDTAFSGDTLFYHSIGRSDLDRSSMFMLIQSLRMVCQLPDQTKVYPGHGQATTIGTELAENPYLDR